MHANRSPARLVTTLAVAFTLLSWVLRPAGQARAEEPPGPSAWILFDLHKLMVHSDQDWGSGEIGISLRVWRVNRGCPAITTEDSCITVLLRTRPMVFSANTGDTIIINVGYPGGPIAGDELADGVSSQFGIPLYSGNVYGWEIRGVEIDTFSDDRLGSLTGTMLERNNWSVGTYFERATDGGIPVGGGACVGGCPGNFSIEFSIRRRVERGPVLHQDGFDPLTRSGTFHTSPDPSSPPPPTPTPTPAPTPTPSPARPDLSVSAIKVRGRVPDGKDDCKDGKNDVAVVVKNTGATAAGAFAVQLEVDGETTNRPVPDLEAGQEREVRFDDVRLRKGDHGLTATADAQKTVPESDEGNNARAVTAACKDDD